MVMRITGLASGLDTDKIIGDLMKAQRMKTLDPLTKKKQMLQWKQEGYREINTKMSALRNAVFDLKLQGSFNARKASAADEKIAGTSANSNAQMGTYSLEVKSLASAARATSSDKIGSQTTFNLGAQFALGDDVEKISFTLAGKDGEKAFEFTKDKTIYDMMSEISNSGIGIQATYDSTTDRVFFSSTTSGQDAKIEVKADDDNFLKNKLKLDLDTPVTGTNAKVNFNGAEDLEFSSNNFTIAGININAKAVGSTEITVSQNSDAIFDKIKSFVDAYNSLLSHLSSLTTTARDRDYEPLTEDERAEMSEEEITKWEAKAKEGIFGGDTFLTSMISSLRMTAMNGASGIKKGTDGMPVAFSTLSSIGISTGSYISGSSGNAVLNIDEDKLRQAIEENPEQVMELFTGNSVKGIEGIASKLTNELDKNVERLVSKAGYGAYTADSSSISEQLRNLDKRIDIVKERNEKLEERYWKQYTALETAMSQLQSQSDWLTNQLAGMSS